MYAYPPQAWASDGVVSVDRPEKLTVSAGAGLILSRHSDSMKAVWAAGHSSCASAAVPVGCDQLASGGVANCHHSEVLDLGGPSNDAGDATSADAWFNFGLRDGGDVNGQLHTSKQCYIKARGCKPNFASAWHRLGLGGGGDVSGQIHTED